MRNLSLGWTGTVLAAALFWCALATTPSHAVTLPDLYTAEVAYDSARRNGRSLAYARALQQVMTRLTPGGATVGVTAALGEADQYVLGWREGASGRLWVSFDGVAISSRLRDAGIGVWGSDRPLTLTWIAMESPGEPRALVGADERVVEMPVSVPEAPDTVSEPRIITAERELRAALAASASAYGVPLALPQLDPVDTSAVSDVDVWGGFEDVVLRASQRYGTSSVLLGKANSERLQSIRWTWLFAGERQEFTGSVEQAAQRVLGDMMAAFASSPEASTGVRVRVVGIDGAARYGQVYRFLSTQSLIERVDVLSMQADSVVFEVDSLTSRERLAGILEGELLTRASDVVSFELGQPTIGATSIGADLEFRVRTEDGLR
ncbi:MAG: DUF2066 domain-containing protein [Pseudomonadota bacterium]